MKSELDEKEIRKLKNKLKLKKDDPVLKEFTCSIKNRLNVNDVYGRFLISEKHFIFASQLFGSSASIIQPLSDIAEITSTEKKLIVRLISKTKVISFFFQRLQFITQIFWL